MAGPRVRLLRRKHTKSRQGCAACKRRHIRCDESLPQCRNCTKYKIRCPYNYVDRTPEPQRVATLIKPNLMWTPQIATDVAEWQRTGVLPFLPPRLCPAPKSQLYATEDLRLIYHLATLYNQFDAINANNFTLWTRHVPILLRIGYSTPYVMHALLAFSAMHIASLTGCPRVSAMAFERRRIALSGVHAAIDVVSRETSDAILAASLILSWQVNDWRSLTQLMQGSSTVIDVIDSWKHESQFTDFIAQVCAFSAAFPSLNSEHRPSQPRTVDPDAFQRILDQVQKVEAHLRHHKEDVTQIKHLAGFLEGAREISPTLSIDQLYERLQPLRTWLLWMPVGCLQNYSASANSLVVIAHFYAVTLFMEHLFLEIGAACFGSLCIFPLEEIARHLMSMSIAGAGECVYTALGLIQSSIDTISEFRSRLGWLLLEKALSISGLSPLNLPVGTEESAIFDNESYHSAFNYSTDEMSVPSNAACMSANGRFSAMSSPLVRQHYINAPLPSLGAYSLASFDTYFLEGPIAYSNLEEYAPFDLQFSRSDPSPISDDSHRH